MLKLLLLTALLFSVSVVHAETSDPEYLPIALKCPAANNGMLDEISKETAGPTVARRRVIYKDGIAISVSLAGSLKGNLDFEEFLSIMLVIHLALSIEISPAVL